MNFMDFSFEGGYMRLITSIYTMEQLNSLAPYLDMALLEYKDTSLNYKDLDLALAIDFCKRNHIDIVLSMDKIYEPTNIDIAKEYLIKYKDLVQYFYVTDLGVCNLAIKLNIEDKIIFDPKTMITNSLDFNSYASFGFHALGISSEITLKDVLKINEKAQKNAFYQVFGERLMFYSKRKLISLYSIKNNTEYPKSDVYFKEATRKDYFPGEENINGTIMYRSYLISYLEELNELKDIAYGFLESYKVSDSIMASVLKIYKEALNGNLMLKEFNALNLNTNKGFAYKDSVYQKEELKL